MHFTTTETKDQKLTPIQKSPADINVEISLSRSLPPFSLSFSYSV